MPKTTLEDAVRIVFECSDQYRLNLANRNVMFISANDKETFCFETTFLPRNFKHLTGVECDLNGADFFDIAERRELKHNDIRFNTNGTTEKKLFVLPQMMKIHITARMVGEYNNSGSFLITDRLAGTTTAAMGFSEDERTGFYIPNTVLKTDVREVTKHPQQRIIAIFRKSIKDAKYAELTYLAKGVTLDDDILSSILEMKVDTANLTATFTIPRKIIEINQQ
jgi:hypothetical protein